MKILKRLIFICLVIIIIFFLIDCSMQKVAEGRDGYTRSNIWAYYLYTESSIVYRDDVCLSDVKNHLTTLGYRVSDHDGLSEKWIKKDEVIPYFYISIDKYTHTVTLSKVSLR